MVQKNFDIPTYVNELDLLGAKDVNLNTLREEFKNVKIATTEKGFSLFGLSEEVEQVLKVLQRMCEVASTQRYVSCEDVDLFARQAKAGEVFHATEEGIILTHGKKQIKVKTEGQLNYLRSLRQNDITVCSGAAGSSKTYAAVCFGLDLLLKKDIDKILITRPMVEAGGERIGAEPGTITDKLTNWLLPCLDVFERVLGKERLEQLVEKGKIQLLPLGRLRGLSFYKTYCVATEMQNSDPVLAKLLVTRIGEGSKICIEGDLEQKDSYKESGLEYLMQSLGGVDGVGIVRMTSADVVRHPIITKLITAFHTFDEQRL